MTKTHSKQTTQQANHAASKPRSKQTTQQSHAIVFHTLYATGHACENMQDCSVAKVTKPKSITYENI